MAVCTCRRWKAEPPAAQLAEQMAANGFSFPRQQTTFDVFLVITDSRPDFCDQHTFAQRVEMAMKWLGSQVKEDWVKIGGDSYGWKKKCRH